MYIVYFAAALDDAFERFNPDSHNHRFAQQMFGSKMVKLSVTALVNFNPLEMSPITRVPLAYTANRWYSNVKNYLLLFDASGTPGNLLHVVLLSLVQ